MRPRPYQSFNFLQTVRAPTGAQLSSVAFQNKVFVIKVNAVNYPPHTDECPPVIEGGVCKPLAN